MLEMLMLHHTPSNPSTVALSRMAMGMRAALPMTPASVRVWAPGPGMRRRR